MRLVITLIFIFLISSGCKSYQMLDGRAKFVYFTVDSSVFSDSSFPQQWIYYHDILNLNGNVVRPVELKSNTTTPVLIAYPTFFSMYDEFLVYPGEHILIKKDRLNYFTFEKVNGSNQRNKELSFFRVYDSLRNYPDILGPRLLSLDSVFILEEKLKNTLNYLEIENATIFDSLIAIYTTSEKFKSIISTYKQNQHFNQLYGFYLQHKDTLRAYGLYKEKCLNLFAKLNDVSEKADLLGVETSLNQMANEILPYPIEKVRRSNEFNMDFDSISKFFRGIPRDYLLSQLIYRVFTRRIPVSSEWMAKYDSLCKDTEYKNLVYKFIERQRKNDQIARKNSIDSNGLLAAGRKKITGLEKLISSNKGNLIILDFWASWCEPCLKEIPAMEHLRKQYEKKKVSFIAISLDRDQQGWEKYLLSTKADPKDNYLLINPFASSFKKDMEIDAIPRYILIDKEGNIVDNDAPRPSDPQLKELIDKYLQ